MVFRFSPKETSTVVLKIKAGDEKATLERLGSFSKKFNPGFDFNFGFWTRPTRPSTFPSGGFRSCRGISQDWRF
ncbi:MAG: hypothetical protein IPJ82_25030 [Lewinellaceae bacterium]|nr:hypothetical protein [Lewinellaceae bacterium]